MPLDPGSFDPSEFPLIRGFIVELADQGPPMGVQMHFCDGNGEEIASFHCYDHVDSRWAELSRQIESATTTHPFRDMDEGWEMLIWRQADHVFVVEGDGREFLTRFRVEAQDFARAWAAAAPEEPTSFRSLAEALARPEHAKALLLFNARLGEVPEQLFTLASLEHLELGLNELAQLPRGIGRLKQLRSLDLRLNRLEALPAELAELQLLEDVNLAENLLTEVPEWIARMPALRSFHIGSNPIRPDSLEAARRRRPDVWFDYGVGPEGTL